MKRYLTAALLACAFPLASVGAQAALVQVNGLVLRADGGFTPRKLPQRAFAPIDFQGFAKVTAMSGGVPPPLERVLLDFDRDGRLTTAGLPTCAPSQIETASPSEARSRCPGAIVGTGSVKALIAREGQAPLPATSALTLFNGPRQGGNPSVVFHAQTTVPALQTFAVLVPIVRRSGAYSYRATLELPPIADGKGSLVYVKVKVGKRFRSAGAERSYVSARCSDSVLETLGRFDFADGTVIYGPVMKPCTVL
jgi:hypothetical protein